LQRCCGDRVSSERAVAARCIASGALVAELRTVGDLDAAMEPLRAKRRRPREVAMLPRQIRVVRGGAPGLGKKK
jgi:hypothetical protein